MTNIINNPICSFKELRESFQKSINLLKKEKDEAEKSTNVIINTLKNKLKEAETKVSSLGVKYKQSKSHQHKQYQSSSHGSQSQSQNQSQSSSTSNLTQSTGPSHIHGHKKKEFSNSNSMPMISEDPNQLKLYFNKIEELSKKNTTLQLENKQLQESVEFYRSSSTKINTDTEENKRLTDEKEAIIKEFEDFKIKYEADIKKLKDEMNSNKLLLVIKQEKDKIEKELKEVKEYYQTTVKTDDILKKENEELNRRITEYAQALIALKNDRDKYKTEYSKIAVEKKSLIQYLNESKDIYEKEIVNLNEKLMQSETINSNINKNNNTTLSNNSTNDPNVNKTANANTNTNANSKPDSISELTQLLIDYLILKDNHKYSISIFDVIPLIINKQSLFKLYQTNKIEINHILLNLFSNIFTLYKYNTKCNEESLLSKFNFYKPNPKDPKERPLTTEETLERISQIDIIDFNAIKAKYINKKNFILNTFKSSLEIIDNLFTKENSKPLLTQPFPVEWINRDTLSSYFNEIELGNYTKQEIYYYIQYEFADLTTLTLKGNFSTDYVYYILLNCDKLTNITFLSCDVEDHLPLITLFIDTLKDLNYLSIMNSALNDDTTAMLLYSLKNNKSISSIVLSNDHISPDGLFKFSDCLITNNTISSIDLSNNDIKDLESFLSVINTNHTDLIKLNLSGNPLAEEDFAALGDFLNENSSLKHLDLSRTLITQKAANHFRICLSKNNTLEELLMNECKFDEDSITIISAQKANQGLKCIEVNNTALSEGCLMVLSSALNTLKAIERLGLRKTEAKGIGLVSLLRIVDKKEGMKEIHLDGNEIDENAIIAISTGAFNKRDEPKIYLTQRLVDEKYLSIVSGISSIVLLDD